MRKICTAFILFFLTVSAWSQNGSFTMDVSQLRAETVYFDIEGSPYIDDVYRLGHVFFRGEKYTLFFRFNAFEGRVELKDRTKRLFFLQKDNILEPTFGGRSYKYLFYSEGDALKRGYLVPLASGEKVTLYLKPHKIYVEAKSPDNGYVAFTKPRYEDVSGYYLQYGKELPQAIKLGKRNLLAMLKGKETELQHYIRQQELDLRKEKDVIQLIQYYNRINPERNSI